MKILKYVINDNHHPIIFTRDYFFSNIIDNVISAGFVIIYYDCDKELFIVKCYGECDTLGISSRSIDNEIIEKHLNGCLY